MTVCLQNHTEHVNAVCGENVEFLYTTAGGTERVIKISLQRLNLLYRQTLL
jgi:hypothetical protein